jgi:hypothetical protein
MTKQFTLTCKKPYSRHSYIVVAKDGNQYTFSDYTSAQSFWFERSQLGTLSHIEVIDKANS